MNSFIIRLVLVDLQAKSYIHKYCFSMDIIDSSIKNRRSDRRKAMKTEEEILTPVLSIVEESSLAGEEHEVTIPTSLLDSNIDTTDADDVQYEFRNDGVTYRVCGMQMSSDCVDTINHDVTSQPSTTGTSESSNPQPVQTIYNYPVNGGIYVIGPSSKVLDPLAPSVQKTVISRVHVENSRPTTVCRRDDKRRATHNEVERRRRDKINNWILKLSKIIPECKQESAKGSFEAQSKGGILAKACDYIAELRETNQRLLVFAKENEQLIAEVDSLSRKVEELRQENERLRGLRD